VSKKVKRIAIICNMEKPSVPELARRIVDTLSGWDMETLLGEWLSEQVKEPGKGLAEEDQIAQADATIVLGGDGTLLNVARRLARAEKEIPVLGINLGKLGFLAEVAIAELDEALLSLRDGTFDISPRSILRSEIISDGEVQVSAPAINEVVVGRRQAGRISVLSADIDGKWLTTYRADGLIVSTTTGSTAHSMAAGGPILSPEMNAWIVTPICPHTLGVRALVVPNTSEIEIRSEQTDVELQMTIDGQEQYDIPKGCKVRVCRHSIRFNLIASKRRSFYEILRQKFNLGDTWAAARDSGE